MVANDTLYINGTALPALAENGLSISREKIWSSKTGRGSNAEMIGDIVAIKYHLECQWPPLTRAQAILLDSLVSQAFFNVTFTDPATNTRKTIRAYAGTPVYPVFSYRDGIKTYQGVAVDLIEK